jgi:hypothetical protein
MSGIEIGGVQLGADRPALSGGRVFFGSGLAYFGTKAGHTLYALG